MGVFSQDFRNIHPGGRNWIFSIYFGNGTCLNFFCCFSSDCEIPNWANEPEISSQLSQYLLQNIDTISCLFLTHNTRRVQWKFLINFSQWKIFHIYEIFRENLSTRWLLIFMMAISQSKIPKIYPVKFCKNSMKSAIKRFLFITLIVKAQKDRENM